MDPVELCEHDRTALLVDGILQLKFLKLMQVCILAAAAWHSF